MEYTTVVQYYPTMPPCLKQCTCTNFVNIDNYNLKVFNYLALAYEIGNISSLSVLLKIIKIKLIK